MSMTNSMAPPDPHPMSQTMTAQDALQVSHAMPGHGDAAQPDIGHGDRADCCDHPRCDDTQCAGGAGSAIASTALGSALLQAPPLQPTITPSFPRRRPGTPFRPPITA